MDTLLIPLFVLTLVSLPLLALALLLYAVPVRAFLRVIIRDEGRGETLGMSWGVLGVRASTVGGGLKADVLILDHAVISHSGVVPIDRNDAMKAPPDLPPSPSSPITSGTSLRFSEIFGLVEEAAGPIGSFLSAFWQQCRFEDARGKVVLGVDDPVLTGEICGMYWATRFLFEACRIFINFEPVFDRAVLELDVTIRMKVERPLLLLVAGVAFARQPALRKATDIIMMRRRGEVSL
jgi:hypothetical protein